VRPHPALGHLEEALALLETGMSDLEIARKRQLSARTIEDHKRKILEVFGTTMEARHQGSQGSPATWASGAVTSSMIRPGTDQRVHHQISAATIRRKSNMTAGHHQLPITPCCLATLIATTSDHARHRLGSGSSRRVI